MAKRFIDPDWKALRKLSPNLQRAFFYCWDKADACGVYEHDQIYMKADLGVSLSISDLSKLPGVQVLDNDKLFFIDFIKVNYITLKDGYNPHKPAFRALEKHKISIEYEPIENLGKSIGAVRSRVSERKRNEVFFRDRFTCQYCSTVLEKEFLVVDHIIPVSKGGLSEIENLTTSCVRCNTSKSNSTLEEFLNSKKEFLNPTKAIQEIIKLDKVFINLEEEGEYKEEDKGEIKKPSAKIFTKPSLQEVTDEMQNAFEAEKFFNYYESNGWRVGKNPMKNWQAAAKNWLKNSKNYATSSKSFTGSVAGIGGKSAGAHELANLLKDELSTFQQPGG